MIFDEKKVLLHRNRAKNTFEKSNHLYNAICDDIIDNLLDLTNFKPQTFIDYSHKNNYLSEKIISQFGCTENYIKQDLILCPMFLHLENNPVQKIKDIAKKLNKNGIFIGTFFGGQTLKELRESFIAIESQQNICYPHIIPMVDIKDAGKIMQLSGFQDIIVNSSIINMQYSSCLKLMKSLQNMGETNPLIKQNKGFYNKNILQSVCKHYDNKYIISTFEIIYCFGSLSK